MAGNKELGFPKTRASSRREQLARTTLRDVRLKGHIYVELRPDGKRFMYFCVLCLARCNSHLVLYDHLSGKLHTTRLASARITLLKPNPWPFNDGMHFFQDRAPLPASNANRDLVIPGVLKEGKISDFEIRFMGVGKIAARFLENDKDSNGIKRLWCEWMGNKDDGDMVTDIAQKHKFAIVVFAYSYNLGRGKIVDDLKDLISGEETEEKESSEKKNDKSFSDPEDISESLSDKYQSESRLLLEGYDNQKELSRLITSKRKKRRFRRQLRDAAKRMCPLCQHKFLLGKDAGTLLNTETGRLACSSRNMSGAFHIFHISCLIHWILLCEFEKCKKQSASDEVKRSSKRKRETKCSGIGEDSDESEIRALTNEIDCGLCPECQGTGIIIETDEIEKLTVSQSELFKYKIEMSDLVREWKKSPEELQNCSAGFRITSPSDENHETVQEKVLPLKLLYFYHATE